MKAHTFIMNKGGERMVQPLSPDYIKYLNDTDSYSLTYDQWKDKKKNKSLLKCNLCGKDKANMAICPKCYY